MVTTLARLTCDEPTARRLAMLLDEALGDDVAVAAFENGERRWAVEITFPVPPHEDAIRDLIAAGGADASALQFSQIEERDWVAESLAGLPPVRAGRFLVHGAHDRRRFPLNLIGIEIEAALAFGTGHHGTTRGCLLAVDRFVKSRERRRHIRILDVGTGTGVLAIAAAKALHVNICATDIDPVAVAIARANARHNGAAAFIIAKVADAQRRIPHRGRFDLILANILVGPLVRMAPQLTRRLKQGGRIVLSGLLPEQANAALAAYRAQRLILERRVTLESWVTLVMLRGRK